MKIRQFKFLIVLFITSYIIYLYNGIKNINIKIGKYYLFYSNTFIIYRISKKFRNT